MLSVGGHMFQTDVLGTTSMLQAQQILHGFNDMGTLVSEGLHIRVIMPYRKTFMVSNEPTGNAGWLAQELLSIGTAAGIFDRAGERYDDQERIGGDIVAAAADSVEARWLFSMFEMTNPVKRPRTHCEIDEANLVKRPRQHGKVDENPVKRPRPHGEIDETRTRRPRGQHDKVDEGIWFLVRPFATAGGSGRQAPRAAVLDSSFEKGIASAARSLKLRPAEWTVLTEHATPQPGETYELTKAIAPAPAASSSTPAPAASSSTPSSPSGLKRPAGAPLVAPAKAHAAAAKRGTGRSRDVEDPPAAQQLRKSAVEVAQHCTPHSHFVPTSKPLYLWCRLQKMRPATTPQTPKSDMPAQKTIGTQSQNLSIRFCCQVGSSASAAIAVTTGGITIATMTDYSTVYTDANTANRAAARSAKSGKADVAADHRARAKACVDARAAFKAHTPRCLRPAVPRV